MAVAAFVVSVLALLVAGGSLAWNVIAWRRSGPQVRVRCWFTAEPGGLTVEAFNEGRGDAEVCEIGFRVDLDDRRGSAVSRLELSGEAESPLPFTLRPQHRGEWKVAADDIWTRASSMLRHPQRARATAAEWPDITIGVGGYVLLGTARLVDSFETESITMRELELRRLATFDDQPET